MAEHKKWNILFPSWVHLTSHWPVLMLARLFLFYLSLQSIFMLLLSASLEPAPQPYGRARHIVTGWLTSSVKRKGTLHNLRTFSHSDPHMDETECYTLHREGWTCSASENICHLVYSV